MNQLYYIQYVIYNIYDIHMGDLVPKITLLNILPLQRHVFKWIHQPTSFGWEVPRSRPWTKSRPHLSFRLRHGCWLLGGSPLLRNCIQQNIFIHVSYPCMKYCIIHLSKTCMQKNNVNNILKQNSSHTFRDVHSTVSERYNTFYRCP